MLEKVPDWPVDAVRSNSALKESDLGQVFTDLVESVLINAAGTVLAWLPFLPPMTCVRQHWYFYQRTAIRSRTIINFTVHRSRGFASPSPEAKPKETFNGKTPSSGCDVVLCNASSGQISVSEQPNISPYPCETIRCRTFPCQEHWHVCVPEEPAERGPTAEG